MEDGNILGMILDYSTFDDSALMRYIAQSQAEALSILYDRYARLVFSVAFAVVGDQAAAEEITQDVFTRVWQKAATYQPEQSRVSTWLTSITRNRAIDILRRQGVRPEYTSISWGDDQSDGLPHPETTPELVELAMMQKKVRVALETLPEDQRQPLILAYFKGMSHSEIADTLGEPLGTVKTRIRLAMQKLRRLLEEGDED
jgi:RNA polymerase sigma-70 factor, ECF subfamily